MQVATCSSLDEVRLHIDRLDRQLLALVAERGAYVSQAARFKKSAAEVAAPQRVAQIIDRLKTLALEVGAEPAVVEATWRAMIGAFIEVERTTHATLHPPSQHLH
jgi:isochorismate pyruvate lyase